MQLEKTSSPVDRRRFRRVSLDLAGRFVLPDRSEHRCRAVDVSPGGAGLLADAPPATGQRIVLYLDEIGRLEGIVRRTGGRSFALTITANSNSRELLTARLIWLANRDELALDDSRSNRRIPLRNRLGKLNLIDGTSLPAQILDLSCTGAAVRLATRLELGTYVTLDGRAATVVRNHDCGHGLAFASILTDEELSALIEG